MLIATDSFPAKLRITLLVLFSLCISFSSASSDDRGISLSVKNNANSSSNRIALIIGNSSYKTAPLKNPLNDATDISKALKKLGFHTTFLPNADRQEMGRAISQFGRKLSQAEIGFFYFAGHGMQVDGRNFLIPVKEDITTEDEVPFKAIDVGMVLAKMESAGNPLNMVFLDACRNNPFARSFRSANQGLAQIDAPAGSLIVYATAPGSVAADGKGRNGVFTENLLSQIGSSGVDVEIMLRKVRQGVVSATGGRQVPWSSSSLTGGFSFNSTSKNITVSKLNLTSKSQVPSKKPVVKIKKTKTPSTHHIGGVELTTFYRNGQTIIELVASGHSDSADKISRRVFAQKSAEKKIRKALISFLASQPYALNRRQAEKLFREGEVIDLEYLNDGKEAAVTFETSTAFL